MSATGLRLVGLHDAVYVAPCHDVQDFESDARRFLERYQTNYVSVRDGGDSTYTAYGLTGLPETYYLDRRGRVVGHSIGEISEDELAAGVAAALEGVSAGG